MVKKFTLLTLILIVLIMVVFSSVIVFGQDPTSVELPNSIVGVQAVNLSSTSATISARYYAEGGILYTLIDQVLAEQGDNYTYYNEPTDVDNFEGAVMLLSDANIAALANTVFADGSAAAYGGVAQGSDSFLLPLIVVDNYNFTSTIGIQNTDPNTAHDVHVIFSQQGGGAFTETYTIQAGAAEVRTLKFNTQAGSGPGVAGWVGSAVVKSVDGTPVVASAFNYGPGNAIYGYTGFAQTGDTYYLPLVRSGFGGNLTGIQVVDANLTTNGDTTVTITYTGSIYNTQFEVIDADYTCVVETILPDNESLTFYNQESVLFTTVYGGSGTGTVIGGECQTKGHANFEATGGKFLGSAIVRATQEQSGSGSFENPPAIAVVVNDIIEAGGSSGAYSGFLASQAAASMISPLSRNGFANQTTGTQVQNIGTETVTVEAVYKTSPLSPNQTDPIITTKTIDPGRSETFYLPSDWKNDQDPNHGNTEWLGSVTVNCLSLDCLIVGITNDASSTGVIDSSVFNMIPIR